MRLVRIPLLAITLGTLGLACGGADEPADTTPATHTSGGVKADVGGEVEVGGDGAGANATGEVKAGEVGGKAGVGVEGDKDSVKAGAGATVEGTTDADKREDDHDKQRQQPLPQGDPNQPNPEKPEQPPQPEQPTTP